MIADDRQPSVNLLQDNKVLLSANQGKPAREQLTLILISEELREWGYGGGSDAVRRYPQRWSTRTAGRRWPSYVPLSFARAYQRETQEMV